MYQKYRIIMYQKFLTFLDQASRRATLAINRRTFLADELQMNCRWYLCRHELMRKTIRV